MKRPRIGFVGTGWIGRHRMAAMIATGAIVPAAICDPSAQSVSEAQALAPFAKVVPSFEAMLAQKLDGLVIATPNALHANYSTAALERGLAVFCQKPLGRDAKEARAVVEAARAADRLLSVDFCYRHAAAAQALAKTIREGALGNAFAADLVFHNAYGPDKMWFYDRAQSGGGCVMDLGIHLVDLLLWLFDFPKVVEVSSCLFGGGAPAAPTAVEDYAITRLTLANGVVARLACSWRLQAGQEAVIEASFYGDGGGASLRNVGGSFYDFEAHRFAGTQSELLVSPPDDWGGRAAAAWAEQLARSRRFDPAAEQLVDVAEVIDRIYER